MSDSKTAFIFFHYGRIPAYLRYAIRQTRRYNPQVRCFLLCDRPERFSMEGVETFSLKDFQHPLLEEFRRSYVHVSPFDEFYERFVLERWFQLEEVRKQLNLEHLILIDSDVLVFGNVDKLIKVCPPVPIAINAHSPHFSVISSSVEDFLRYIINAYADPANVERGREKARKAKEGGGLWTLGEMTILLEYLYLERDMRMYPNEFGHGHICTNIHLPEGLRFKQLRRRPRKRVFWEVEGEKLVPHFERESDGTVMPAFTIHFQGSAKRILSRMEWIEAYLPLSLQTRCKVFNCLF